MTAEQMQALLDMVSDTKNQLVNMMAALEVAIELHDELSPADNAKLATHWYKQVRELRTLYNKLPEPAPQVHHFPREQLSQVVPRVK